MFFSTFRFVLLESSSTEELSVAIWTDIRYRVLINFSHILFIRDKSGASTSSATRGLVLLGGFETPTRRSSVFRSTVLSYRSISEILLFLNQKEDCRIAVRISLVHREGVEPSVSTLSEWQTNQSLCLWIVSHVPLSVSVSPKLTRLFSLRSGIRTPVISACKADAINQLGESEIMFMLATALEQEPCPVRFLYLMALGRNIARAHTVA